MLLSPLFFSRYTYLLYTKFIYHFIVIILRIIQMNTFLEYKRLNDNHASSTLLIWNFETIEIRSPHVSFFQIILFHSK